MKMLSACLCGVNCKYNGGNNYEPRLDELLNQAPFILVCPETSGGLPVPRYPCEIIGGTGKDVIAGYAKVVDIKGSDVTDYFIIGAYKTLLSAKNNKVDHVILKSRSPSCGSGHVYDGTFTSRKIAGDGVTSALLKMHGFIVTSDEDYLSKHRSDIY